MAKVEVDADVSKIKFVCDDCLKPMKIRRGGQRCRTTCECGTRLMRVHSSRVMVEDTKMTCLASFFIREHDLSEASLAYDHAEARIEIEHLHGIVLEDEEDVSLFLNVTSRGTKPIDMLERTGSRLLELYEMFSGKSQPTKKVRKT